MLPALVLPVDLADYTQGKVSADDPRLPPLLNAATVAVRRYCGWHIAPVVEEEFVLDGTGADVAMLPTMRVVDVLAFTDDGRAVDVASLEWSQKGMVRRRGGRWTDKFRGVRASVQHGYDDAPDVEQIIKQVVSAALSSPMGATREQAGALAVTWAATGVGVSGGLSLLERDLTILAQYRLRDA